MNNNRKIEMRIDALKRLLCYGEFVALVLFIVFLGFVVNQTYDKTYLPIAVFSLALVVVVFIVIGSKRHGINSVLTPNLYIDAIFITAVISLLLNEKWLLVGIMGICTCVIDIIRWFINKCFDI